ncbi:MAG: M28 family metallopeptidase [Candidatus Helarchaeota archaeon]
MNFGQDEQINKKQILDFATNLSFPRRNGSEGNLKARELLKSWFSDLGFKNINTESFKWNPRIRPLYFRFFTVPLTILMFVEVITIIELIFLLVFSGIFTIQLICEFTTGCTIMILMIILFSFGHVLTKLAFLHRERYFSSKLRDAQNISVEIAAEEKPKSRLVIIGAHYDSINTRFGDMTNIILYLGRFAGVFFVSILTLILPFVTMILQFFQLMSVSIILNTILLIIVLYAGFSLMVSFFNTLHNKSEGAIDNASGVAVVLGCAAWLKKNPPATVDVICVLFDVEEEGLIGSMHFASNNLNKFEKYGIEKVHMICLDGPGSKGKLGFSGSFGFPIKTTTDRGIINELQQEANKLRYQTRKIWFPYGGSDHVPFGMLKIDSCHFFSTSIVSNTISDKKELLNEENLFRATNIVINYIRELDSGEI